MVANRPATQWVSEPSIAKSKVSYDLLRIHPSCDFNRTDDAGDPHYLVYSYADSTPSISVASVMDEVGNSSNLNVEYDATNDRLRIYLAHNTGGGSSNWSSVDMDNYRQAQ